MIIYYIFSEDSCNVVFSCNEMSILRMDFNIDLNNNFAEDDHDTIILTRLLARDIKFN